MRTRAGLGSGLELILPGGLWTNVPVAEPFAARSPYVIARTVSGYVVRHEKEDVAPVRLSPRPPPERWHRLESRSHDDRHSPGS